MTHPRNTTGDFLTVILLILAGVLVVAFQDVTAFKVLGLLVVGASLWRR